MCHTAYLHHFFSLQQLLYLYAPHLEADQQMLREVKELVKGHTATPKSQDCLQSQALIISCPPEEKGTQQAFHVSPGPFNWGIC